MIMTEDDLNNNPKEQPKNNLVRKILIPGTIIAAVALAGVASTLFYYSAERLGFINNKKYEPKMYRKEHCNDVEKILAKYDKLNEEYESELKNAPDCNSDACVDLQKNLEDTFQKANVLWDNYSLNANICSEDLATRFQAAKIDRIQMQTQKADQAEEEDIRESEIDVDVRLQYSENMAKLAEMTRYCSKDPKVWAKILYDAKLDRHTYPQAETCASYIAAKYNTDFPGAYNILANDLKPIDDFIDIFNEIDYEKSKEYATTLKTWKISVMNNFTSLLNSYQSNLSLSDLNDGQNIDEGKEASKTKNVDNTGAKKDCSEQAKNKWLFANKNKYDNRRAAIAAWHNMCP